MDSVTQLLLGAVVGESVAGRQVGRKAAAWGAFLGTLPDLDALVRYANPVDSFTYHRSYSHSILVFMVLTPILLWLILKLHPHTAVHRRRWAWLVSLCLLTHVLLDALTIYGTQLLWPLTEYPFGLGSIFIIDPLYSVPLLVGILGVLLMRGEKARKSARRILNGGLLISTLYLSWSLVAQQWMTSRVESLLESRGVTAKLLTVTPAPFNTILWRFVARVDGGYHEGFVSLLDRTRNVPIKFHPSDDQWQVELQRIPSAARLMWFTKGQYSIHRDNDELIVSDLRMGVAPDYVFGYRVARVSEGVVREQFPRRINNRKVTRQKLDWLVQRLNNPALSLPVGNFRQDLPRMY